MNYKVSVVIPMYKARDYIIENVDCLLKQTLSETEIIIVNDCTPDDSMELCREHYAGNERVQLIDQPKNMGPGAARNTGIKAAKGEYIAFVDSDDGVVPDAFEKMYNDAKKYDADVLHNTGCIFPLMVDAPANLLTVPKKDWLNVNTDRVETATDVRIAPDDMAERFEMWKKQMYHWAVWNKLYKREFLLKYDIHFGEMKLAEDLAFCFSCLFNAKKYVTIPGNFYLYRMSETSLCRGKDYIKLLERSLNSVLAAPDVMKNNMKGIPFFEDDPVHKREAVDFIIENLERVYIRPAYQELGEEEIRKDGTVKKIFDEKYGDNSDFVYFTFMELHKNYPPIPDYVKKASDINYLIKIREKYGKELIKGMAENQTEEKK